MSFDRRTVISGFGALGVAGFAGQAFAQAADVVADSAEDQSAALQKAINVAAARAQALFLPGGTYLASELVLPSGLLLTGVPGATLIRLNAPGILLRIENAEGVTLEGIGLDGAMISGGDGVVSVRASTGISLSRLSLQRASADLLRIEDAGVTISDCRFADAADNAIFANDSRGLLITGNMITGSGNGGIRIWRSEAGHDGTIITSNTIDATGSVGGGNGQNGNGVNVFRAGGVIIADNQIGGSSFSAIRLNASNDCQVSGNICRDSGECALFSEFGFSGSVLANNIIDGAATGISMTNFNEGGRLAVCTGNIVRNITPVSLVNPDTSPVGIFAEADTAVTGNVVEAVPGIGIGAGYGPYLRNVLISDNVVRDCDAGIVVSVAPEAGTVRIAGNLIASAKRYAIAGAAWDDVLAPDLVADAAKYPHVTVEGNTVGL